LVRAGTNYLHRVPKLFGKIKQEKVTNVAKMFVREY